jgi:hypothetical protein
VSTVSHSTSYITHIFRSNGQTIEVMNPHNFPVNTVVRLRSRSKESVPEMLPVLPNQSWNNLTKVFFHYYLATGKSSKSRCRGCDALLPKEQIRIRTPFLRHNVYGEISTCANDSCLAKVVTQYKHQVRYRDSIVQADYSVDMDLQ